MSVPVLAAACALLLGCAAEAPNDPVLGGADATPGGQDATPGDLDATPESADAGPLGGADAMPAPPDGAPPDDTPSPPKPPGLVTWEVGNDGDAQVNASGPALLLEGGAFDVNAAFDWWTPLINHGDVVVLRTTGADGYNAYIYQNGAVDSVETMLVTTKALANSDYVAWRVQHAEAVFFAGGSQDDTSSNGARYPARGRARGDDRARGRPRRHQRRLRRDRPVHLLGHGRQRRGAEALANPYRGSMTLVRDFMPTSALAGLITDTHFGARDRMGRLVAFVARVISDGWVAPTAGARPGHRREHRGHGRSPGQRQGARRRRRVPRGAERRAHALQRR